MKVEIPTHEQSAPDSIEVEWLAGAIYKQSTDPPLDIRENYFDNN